MLQVVQYQKTGKVSVEELPSPGCPEGGVLVRTDYSLISAGTEKISVTNTKSSLIQRARKQPDQVKLVIDFLKRDGVISTAKRVLSTLDSYKILGYSASGTVVESRCDEFSPGDMVACAGAGIANHAEMLAVPKNLTARIPSNVDSADAAYTTVGTIAMQGVRQADVRLGENVAVIGLGLIGQITVQLLKASGCRVAGADIDTSLFDLAKKSGCDEVFPSSFDSIDSMLAFTGGIGFDSVIITASTPSDQPAELALKLARKKGKVIIVGAIGMNLPRSPFYEKELDLRMSCSYGPGRYDANYEQRGQDYPPAYVRWTENRNMQSFLQLISSGSIDMKMLTTHTFDINKAPDAYGLITDNTEPYLGILLQYPQREGADKRTINIKTENSKTDKVKITFVGAGSFAKSFLLPPLKSLGTEMVAVSTATAVNAETMARQYGFGQASTDSSTIIADKNSNTVFCATQHDTHGQYVLEAVNAGKAVFVEKPLCTNTGQLKKINDAVEKNNGRVMVGFNRRFSKSFELIKEFFSSRKEPMNIMYRANAGKMPKSHWVLTPENGGRIIGEACHFIDCMAYLTGAKAVSVYAKAIGAVDTEITNRDNVSIVISFDDGSVGTVLYFADGASTIPKEYCEVYCEKATAVMNNFKSVELHRAGKIKKHSLDGRKGHDEEVKAFIESLRQGKNLPIDYSTLQNITLATFAAEESISTGRVININELI